MINILHMTPWNLGGATTFVVNLQQTLAAAGVPHRVVRIAKKTERVKREMGKYGTYYQNVGFDDALKGKGVWLLASAPTTEQAAIQAIQLVESSNGAYVFHDPNEFKLYPHWRECKRDRVICIRETGLDSMPSGVFIPHPYVRIVSEDADWLRSQHAVSIARISAVKNSDWILQANRTLPNGYKVDMYGELNRFWWNFNIKPKHPDWQVPTMAGFARERGAAVQICQRYDYMIDMTIFKQDGGGTQYSLLEAMDAGAVPVMTSDWVSYPGPAKNLGFAVEDADSLCAFLANAATDKSLAKQTEAYREHNYNYLNVTHNPVTIASKYAKYLGV